MTWNGKDALRHVSLRDHTHILHLSEKADVLVLQVLQLRVTSYTKPHLLVARIQLRFDLRHLVVNRLRSGSILGRRSSLGGGSLVSHSFVLKQRRGRMEETRKGKSGGNRGDAGAETPTRSTKGKRRNTILWLLRFNRRNTIRKEMMECRLRGKQAIPLIEKAHNTV